ncbi:pyridoxal phosphate-dependent aminotransferase [Hutsoniella sourekii]|uniref:pyridoxal phosphate-dependent aminotransferase n=1 Tax=Hutsoniella sourekii TaxID=87650 RepID=UPI0004B72864|nr:aminotransferase class I/II-fold pyridoxal phosphate-dependent enzyme [Hutsoniella sourekii]
MDYSNINQWVQQAPGNSIRTFNDKISHIEGLMYFNIGEPDFATPEVIKEAAKAAIDADISGYAHSRGVLALRQAISNYLAKNYQLNYDADTDILVTTGSTEALMVATMGLLNPGEQLVVVEPNYVIYNTHAILAGGSTLPINTSQTGLKLDPDVLDQTLDQNPKAKALMLNYPSNPTGVTYDRQELEAIAEVCRKHDLYIITDEVYAVLTYSGHHVSIAEIAPERTLLINGNSKAHAMTGWRCGFLAGPSELIEALYPLHQAAVTCVTSFVQYGAIAAYEEADPDVERMYQSYDERRHLIYQGLTDLGLQALYPQGAFYLFVKVPDWFRGDDYEFCLALAHEAKLAVTPGQLFGESGRGYFRVSYASSLKDLKIFIQRFKEFQDKYTH